MIRLKPILDAILSEKKDMIDPRINPNWDKGDNEDIDLGIDPETMLGRWTIEWMGKPTPKFKTKKKKKDE